MKEYTVNRKQFHFLLDKFLAEHRLKEKWFNASMSFKMQDTLRRSTYERYNIKSIDNYNEHLYKCIDIYIGEAVNKNKKEYRLYRNCIYGFFRFIPSGGCDSGDSWETFWKNYSDIWQEKTYNIGYDENNS
jgi:hypothetical protein